MTQKARIKMTAFFHRLIYIVLGFEAVIIMVYMMMGLTSCSNDHEEDIDTPTAELMVNRTFEGTAH